ncbi:hypothetical protein B0T14DRAFT_385388, partial [Immersiella caudata]
MMNLVVGWLDHVLFAMGPLGILTALVSAIRVGGYPWLKAIIGRARENRAAVEIELMSSTSHEVCEVWNGEGIVRSLGKPGIRQIIYLECDKDSNETLGLHTISTARHSPDISNRSSQYTLDRNSQDGPRFFSSPHPPSPNISPELSHHSDSRRDQHHRPSPPVLTPEPEIRPHSHPNAKSREGPNPPEVAAPSISLNIHGGSNYGEILAGAIFGSICQFGVLIFTGFSVYHPTFSLKFPKGGEEVPGYSYPIMALGTVMLTIGMILCSHVIVSSTRETKFILQSAAQSNTSKQTIGTTSIQWRLTGLHPQLGALGVLTLLGVALGLIGYVLQFQGLRALNWTASISQLVCLALMTLLRAWVRRGLIAKPIAKRVLEDHEMDYLSILMASSTSGNFWPAKRDGES